MKKLQVVKPTWAEVNAIDLTNLHTSSGTERPLEFLNGAPGQEHYKLLAWFSKQLKGGRITEVGTYDGCGSLALSYNAKNTVTSWDLRHYDNCSNLPTNVECKLSHRVWFSEAVKSNIIFYDAMHDGQEERRIIRSLYDFGWKGVVILDDIFLHDCMKEMWEWLGLMIELRKEDWTDIGHSCGTGIVFFD